MKQLSICLLCLLFIRAIPLHGQSASTTITYKDALRPALTLPLVHNPDIAEQTILAKLKETGYKPQTKGNAFRKKNKQDGFYFFPGVKLPELTNQQLDLYFKVDPLNQDNYHSSISLMVSKGYDNFVSPETDSATFEAAQNFLNGFVTETAALQLDKQLEEQKHKIADSEKKWQDVKNKKEEAQKKIAQLQADIKNWEEQEQAQKLDVDTQRSALQELEAKRSTIQK
jgi:hypothetical protein